MVTQLNLLTVPTFKIYEFKKSKMAAAAVFLKTKNTISQQRFERCGRNLVRGMHIYPVKPVDC